MMDLMKAYKIYGPLNMQCGDFPLPKIGDNEVLIRTAAVGICATDIELYDGRMPYIQQGLTKLPIIPGHEWSGWVCETGCRVNDVNVGELVVGDISLGCGECINCLKGSYHLCQGRTELGIIEQDGALAQYLKTKGKHVYRVPNGINFLEAAFAEPLATCINAIRRTGIPPGAEAVVFGDGVIGFLAAQLALCFGSSKVLLVARKPDHARTAEELGLLHLSSPGVEVISEVRRIFGRLPEVVIECTGNSSVLNDAVHCTAPGGRICALSITGDTVVPLDMDYIVTRDIRLVGSLASPNAFPAALALMAAGRVKVKPLISRVFPFSQVCEAFEYVRLRKGPRIKVVITVDEKETFGR